MTHTLELLVSLNKKQMLPMSLVLTLSEHSQTSQQKEMCLNTEMEAMEALIPS